MGCAAIPLVARWHILKRLDILHNQNEECTPRLAPSEQLLRLPDNLFHILRKLQIGYKQLFQANASHPHKDRHGKYLSPNSELSNTQIKIKNDYKVDAAFALRLLVDLYR